MSKRKTLEDFLQNGESDLFVEQGKDGKPRVLRKRKEIKRTLIGIDPGVKTGFAVWSCKEQRLIRVETLTIIHAMDEVKKLLIPGVNLEIWFEDARLRKWFGDDPKKVKAKLQGAGSIKRDCSVWQEFCDMHEIKYKAIAPGKGQTKWPADYFRKVTGWTARTSEHARDAATLIYGVR